MRLLFLLVVGAWRAVESKTVAVVDASGYIGSACVAASLRQGYETIAVCRKSPGEQHWPDAVEVVIADVTEPDSLRKELGSRRIDAVISCLASKRGTKADSWLVDYKAAKNCFDVLIREGAERRDSGVGHFVLLSAFCVQKPLLHFQKAKLRLEREIREEVEISGGNLRYTIVRPTAFFKSLSMQLDGLKSGMPFMVFDGGDGCRCNPIAESELADYMLSSIANPSLWNRTRVVGGPDAGISKKDQGMMMMNAMGMSPEFAANNIIDAPLEIFDVVVSFCGSLAVGLRKLGFFKAAREVMDVAEVIRIGRYYAVEDMLGGEGDERYGRITLMDHFRTIVEKGQAIDEYVAVPAWARRSMMLASKLLKDKTSSSPLE